MEAGLWSMREGVDTKVKVLARAVVLRALNRRGGEKGKFLRSRTSQMPKAGFSEERRSGRSRATADH